MSQVFTRKELYDLVWSTPISKLAQQFNMSDRGLAKTCDRHQIPVPGRGYWAKIDAGQPATKTPLWKIDNPTLDAVHVGAFKPEPGAYATFAIAVANKAVETARAGRIPEPTKHALRRVEQEEAVERPKPEDVTLPSVRRYHGSIEQMVATVKAAEPNEHGAIVLPLLHIHKTSRSRIIVFLHHLAVALEVRGISLN